MVNLEPDSSATSETMSDDPTTNVLEDMTTPQSLQNHPSILNPSSANNSDDLISLDLSILTPQEAANVLYVNNNSSNESDGCEILAPMVRASTTPLRILALQYGATLTYSEEIVDRSIIKAERSINADLGTVDYRHGVEGMSAKVLRRLANDRDNPDNVMMSSTIGGGNGTNDVINNVLGPLVLRIDPLLERNRLIYQLGTGESALALSAALKVYQDVAGLDINMGCPKKFSVSGGMGSALLEDVARACDIIKCLRRGVPKKPVSAKIRLLDATDPRPTIDFCKNLIQAGANAIAIHGRIVGDESDIDARWETLAAVVRELKSSGSASCVEGGVGVPIVVNGDLYTRRDINEMKRRTGCDGVMLARPALYNISLFRRGVSESDYGNEHNDETGTQQQQQHQYDRQSNKEDGIQSNNLNKVPLSQFQKLHHTGYYGYDSPLLASRTTIVQEYIANCVRYRTHPKNAKYVVCEMMNTRRAPTNRIPYLNMEYPRGQTVAQVCKCRSLNDLVKLWDVNFTKTLPNGGMNGNNESGVVNAPIAATNATTNATNTTHAPSSSLCCKEAASKDLHNYDDRYFLDPDKFRKERTNAVKAMEATTLPTLRNKEKVENENKDGCSEEHQSAEPVVKRPKV